jgi:hypothetical protein
VIFERQIEMVTEMLGRQLPQTNKAIRLNDKMLALAQELFLTEMANDTLFGCGDDITCKLAGHYGLYETLDGEIISFQPKSYLIFTLICDRFIIAHDLATIQVIASHLDEYELSVS